MSPTPAEKQTAETIVFPRFTARLNGLHLQELGMHTFDLKWPKTSATFCTNGWRCRIVWREKASGLGGTIENNDQCKRRAAESLESAPELLDELRAAGYRDLAEEIRSLAPGPSAAAESPDEPAGPTPSPGDLIDAWAEALPGSASWEACGNRRARSWQELVVADVGVGDDARREQVLLKTPVAKGKREWVLKCVWHAAPKGDARGAPRYYAAESFHGLCGCLAAQQEYRSMEFVDAFVDAVRQLTDGYPEVAEAVAGWDGCKALLDQPRSLH